MTEPQLFVVYLGGEPAPGRMGEDHEVVLVVAEDVKSARTQARAKWSGSSRPHIDAISVVHRVDGYDIGLSSGQPGDLLDIDLTYEE